MEEKQTDKYIKIINKKEYEKLENMDYILCLAFLLTRYKFDDPIRIKFIKDSLPCSLIYDVSGYKYEEEKKILENILNQNNDSRLDTIELIICNKISEVEKFFSDTDLCIAIDDEEVIHIYCNKHKKDKEEFEMLICNYLYLLEQVLSDNTKKIMEYGIVNPFEIEKINSFNTRNITCMYTESFMNYFNENVIKHADKFAVIQDQKCLTYRELNEIANYYASKIINYSSKYIGIYSKNDLCTIIAILSILKAGKCVVTINPTYPKKRVLKIVEQLNIDYVFTCNELIKVLQECHDFKSIIVDAENYEKQKYIPFVEPQPEDPCYVIFTSGSTGEPKGVSISHENIMIEIIWLTKYFQYDENIKSLHVLNYSFDFGLYDILASLYCGGTLYCPSQIRNLKQYVDEINKNQINNINTTPSFFNIITSFKIAIPSMRYVHLGGEKVLYEYLVKYNKVLDKKCRIFNGYGPCECTVGCIIHEVTSNEKMGISDNKGSVPIGKPTDDSYIHLFNQNREIVPINGIGEICVSGKSLGIGYINQEQNTSFFCIDDERYYATGDLAKWLHNGEIEFIGRKDEQIKLNGFRIELSEIDMLIMKDKSVRQVKTIYKNKIYSFVEVADKTIIDEIKQNLIDNLPYYMVPSKIIVIDKMPQLASGKINIKKLEEMV